jgi:hypothetical protein
VIQKHILEPLKIFCGHRGWIGEKNSFFCYEFLNDDFQRLRKKIPILSFIDFCQQYIEFS